MQVDTKRDMTVDELQVGEQSFIAQFDSARLEAKLLAMGILPGKPLEVIRRSALGHTLYIKVDGRLLALRKSEAACIQVK